MSWKKIRRYGAVTVAVMLFFTSIPQYAFGWETGSANPARPPLRIPVIETPNKKEAPAYVVSDQIQNGGFDEAIDWMVEGYPYGYLPGWKLSDTEFWDYQIEDGILQVRNRSDKSESRSFEISQNVRLKPGTYLFNAVSAREWDEENTDGICLRVAEPDGTLIAERYWNPGYGEILTDPFRIDREKEVTVSVTCTLAGGKKATLDNLEISGYPNEIKWNTAGQVGGISKRRDTMQLNVSFSRPVFDLGKENFTISGAVVEDLTSTGNGGYLLDIGELRTGNAGRVEITVTNPEYANIVPRTKTVTVYRDLEEQPKDQRNGDFSSEVDWEREEYPDGYLDGWVLPKVDWDIWKYSVLNGVFELSNISDSQARSRFTMHQAMVLEPGTYSVKAYSGWSWDEDNKNGISIRVKSGKKILASVGKNPGAGLIESDVFTIEKETPVDCIVELSLAGGDSVGLDYISILPCQEASFLEVSQVDGVPGQADTTKLLLSFDKEITGIAAEDVTVEKAVVSQMTHIGGGVYELTLDQTSFQNGQEAEVLVNNPKGYQIMPSSRKVVVYRLVRPTEEAIWVSAEQLGGSDGMEPTTAVELVFDREIEGLQAAHFTTVGASKGALVPKGEGVYELELNRIAVNNGEEITVEVESPDGYVIAPNIRTVVVYKDDLVFTDPIINGDFSTGIDWSNSADYPYGYLKGWELPDIDWSVWSYAAGGGDGGDFYVRNVSAEPSAGTYAIRQQVTLNSGWYELSAKSNYTWDAANPTGVTLEVLSGGSGLTMVQACPGTGVITTDAFWIDTETEVEIVITCSLAGGADMGLDDVIITETEPPSENVLLLPESLETASPADASPEIESPETVPPETAPPETASPAIASEESLSRTKRKEKE